MWAFISAWNLHFLWSDSRFLPRLKLKRKSHQNLGYVHAHDRQNSKSIFFGTTDLCSEPITFDGFLQWLYTFSRLHRHTLYLHQCSHSYGFFQKTDFWTFVRIKKKIDLFYRFYSLILHFCKLYKCDATCCELGNIGLFKCQKYYQYPFLGYQYYWYYIEIYLRSLI